MSNPFFYVDAINDARNVEVGKDYNAFLTNRAFSLFRDTIFIANMANQQTALDNNARFCFYRSLVTKKKRFTKWPKVADPDLINLVARYFDFSPTKALEAIKILSKEEVDKIKHWASEKEDNSVEL